MDLSLRPATTADHALAVKLMREFYSEEHLVFGPPVEHALSQLLQDTSLGQFYLLDVASRPIGYLVLLHGFILEFGGRQSFIDELYVQAAFRRLGYARQALELAAAICRDDGSRVMRLEVDRVNAPAIRLYQRTGFRLHDRSTMTRVLD
jgi:ribosomal protein S18 acetylase RimI-like enzyme